MLGTILKVDEGRISINGPEDKKTHDDAHGLTSKRWHSLYVSRKEGGRGLARIEDCVDTSIQWLEDYIK